MSQIQELGKKAKGGPVGNKKGSETYCIKSAIHWALAQDYNEIERGKALKAIAQKAVMDAINGDKAAREWISERTEGKVAQILSGPDGGAIPVSLNVAFR